MDDCTGNAIKGKDGRRHRVAKYTLSEGKDPVLGIRRIKSVTYACGAMDELPGCAHEYYTRQIDAWVAGTDCPTCQPPPAQHSR